MKRVISLLLSVLFVLNCAFARNFFSSRIFEVKANVPVGLSNNSFSLNDYLVKDLVIDLQKITEGIPEKGFMINAKANPSVSMKIDCSLFSIGAKVGADAYINLGISKDLFKFVSEGYKVGDTLDVSLVDPTVDLYTYIDAPIGIRTNSFVLDVIPSAFVPLTVMQDSKVKATLVNTSDGRISAKVNGDINLYTNKELLKLVTSMQNNDGTNTNGTAPAGALNFASLANYMGYDLGLNFGMPLGKTMFIRGDARIPLIPGKLDASMNVKANMNFDDKITNMAQAGQNMAFNYEMKGSELAEVVKVNRPMKFHAYFDYNPISIIEMTIGAGLGVRHPGSADSTVYPEYYASVGLNLIDMLKFSVSTSYFDKVFNQSAKLVLGLRFVEVEAGVSLSSPRFDRCFDVSGVSVDVVATVGF